jgi:broad specificity phosphatase PhoE
MIIHLIRHGESLANTGEVDPQAAGDHRTGLSDVGHAQARDATRCLAPQTDEVGVSVGVEGE